MKTKIKKILLDNLTSAYDDGNIENGGIIGGDNAIDKLYDLFVDEISIITSTNPIITSRPEVKDRPICDIDKCDHPEEWRTHYEGGSSWCRKCWCYVDLPPVYQDKKGKLGDTPYFNPTTGKMGKLFDILNPVYTVCYKNHEVGDKGEAVYITLEANTEEHAKELAMLNKEFTKHIYMKYYNKKCLDAYRATGNYVIGKVNYYSGDPRL
jgi:hypothetical protein